MNLILGLIVIAVGVAIFVAAPRMTRANEASSEAAFGKRNPYRKNPQRTRKASLFINRLVGLFFVIMGVLEATGIIVWL